jgi:transcriptional regulator with PAS, ATPase and Fis domain
LRERKNDILPTARHLLKQMAGEANFSEIKIDQDAAGILKSYGWPGNVRELFNVLERTIPALGGDTIYLENLPFYLHHTRQKFSEPYRSSLKDVQATTEKEAIRYALQESGHNKARAARMLGIHRTQLYKKMKKFNLPL